MNSGLIRFRLHVEIEWLIALASHPQVSELPSFSSETIGTLHEIARGISVRDAVAVKDIERDTNHDVKALEYFLKKRLKDVPEVANSLEFIHFGCTSYDINDNCFGLMLKEARDSVLIPKLAGLVVNTVRHGRTIRRCVDAGSNAWPARITDYSRQRNESFRIQT